MILEIGTILKMTPCFVLAVVFTSFVIGVSNSKAAVSQPILQGVNCRTSRHYTNVSRFDFVPQSVAAEDTPCLVLRMFQEMGFINQFNIPEDTLSRFILQVQKGYRDVPYHNWAHGFEVLHFSFAVLKNCQLIEKQHFTQLEGLALLTSAMCHDLDHPGTNNQFQKETNSTLAQKYGEQGSILERHHTAQMLGLLRNMEMNFLAQMDEKSRSTFYDLISQIVLATDLAVHFSVIGEEQRMATAGFNHLNSRHKHLLRSIIISCADLSSSAQPWPIGLPIVKKLFKEFFAQGDLERQLGLIPAAMMDRQVAIIPEQEVDFLSKVVIPGFQTLVTLYPETQPFMASLQTNLVNWRKAIPFFENQQKLGRNQMDILSDNTLENISTWSKTK